MFGISWLTPELFVQSSSIVVGFILGAILTLILQRRQWAKEQAHKDMEIIYHPISRDINKLLKKEKVWRRSPTSPYTTHIATYEGLKSSKRVIPETHDELRKDMKDLIGRINKEDEAFNILLNKTKPLCKRTLESIPVATYILGRNELKCLYDYFKIDEYDFIHRNREEWGTNFDNMIKKSEDHPEIVEVGIGVTGNELYDQLFSQVKDERKDSFSKRDEIFTKAKEIEKKLDYKTRHTKKRYGKQLKNRLKGVLEFIYNHVHNKDID